MRCPSEFIGRRLCLSVHLAEPRSPHYPSPTAALFFPCIMPLQRPAYTGSERKLVVGIDIGTTFSGVSYCILEPGRIPEIKPVTHFPFQPSASSDSKVPSIVYYDLEGKARAFGAEAVDESVRDKAVDEQWEKAEWFKLHMRPPSVPLPATLTISAASLPPLPANKTVLEVFADFLRYLFNCLRMYIRDTYGAALWGLLEDDTQYVLTHPNGWLGEQQAALRRAVVAAGLISDTPGGHERVQFVTEGEASLSFCVLNGLAMSALNEGKGVIIIDAGGGTVDISAYRKAQGGENRDKYQEITRTACLMNGSVFVTRNAKEYGTAPQSDIDAIADCFDQSTKLKFRGEEFAYIRFGTLRDRDPSFEIKNGQLKLAGAVVARFFQPSIEAIVQAIQQQCSAASADITTVLLVGGFGASQWLFSELERRLIGIEVLRPSSRGNKAVSDGAVSFYLDHLVSSRVAKDTYGKATCDSYDALDPQHQARTSSLFMNAAGAMLVPNVFTAILQRGVSVSEEQEFRHSFLKTAASIGPLTTYSTDILRYRGDDEFPQWVDVDADNYSILCTVKADTSSLAQSLTPRFSASGMYYQLDFDIVLSFGLTELKAQIAWNENGVEKRSPAEIVYDEV
ncbi:hypothetical protein MKEN_01113700 [Mycena kentingensis (nom. inval.)]|nr:hypothetical protein MKEN_01113700 [Mycena kentingensis (nom. inval.)]